MPEMRTLEIAENVCGIRRAMEQADAGPLIMLQRRMPYLIVRADQFVGLSPAEIRDLQARIELDLED